MDSSSEEVGPTEETVLTLLDFLVDPLLPSKSSSRESSLCPYQEELVAKQVHAVVLLYNYYHRKQHSGLEFLDFESFCKMAVVLKPSLLSYLRLMQRSDYAKLDDLDKQLSLTEKAIMNACNISKSLDASNNNPTVEGWPITKVAVFLVDSKKENCYLFHSSITQGVWSVIEKEVNVPLQSSDVLKTGERSGNKKKQVLNREPKENPTADEGGLRKLACLAVKEVCGFSQADLKTLENHVVYSIGKEKTAVHFYIMQCAQTNQDVNLVPISDALDSLRGPLVRKEYGSWIVTPVVEYFHLLPIADKLSDWLSREALPNTSQHFGTVKDDVNCNKTLLNVVKEVVNCNNSHLNEERVLNTSQEKEVGNGNNSHLNEERVLNTSQEKDVGNGNSYHVKEEPLEEPLPYNSQLSEASNSHRKKESTKIFLVYKKRNRSQKNFSSSKNPASTTTNASIEYSRLEDEECAVTGSSNNMDIDESFRTCSPADGKSKSCAIVVAEVLGNLPSSHEHNGEKVLSDDKISDIAWSDENEKQDHALVSFNSNSKYLHKIQLIIASKENLITQTALKSLYRKREILSQKVRSIADELALCDRNIQTILSGGEDDFAAKIDSIIEGCNDMCLRGASQADRESLHFQDEDLPPVVKRKRLSEANLYVQSPCRELDCICNENSWILPTYQVSASEGGFQASVTVKGVDFQCSSEGAICATAYEARNSAALKILVKLRSMATES